MAYERTRVLMGLDANDRPVYKQISGRSQDQRNDNIVRAYIEAGESATSCLKCAPLLHVLLHTPIHFRNMRRNGLGASNPIFGKRLRSRKGDG